MQKGYIFASTNKQIINDKTKEIMTLAELKDRVSIRRGNGYCSYIITITYYGKEYTCHSNNSLAWDRLSDAAYRSPKDNSGEGLTEKEAYEQLMWECKRANGIIY